MAHLKKYIIGWILAMIITLLIVPSLTPARAALPVIDIKRLVEEIAKSFLTSMLSKANDRYLGSFVNRTLDKYRIKDYYNYEKSLADQVHASKMIKDKKDKDKFIISSIIADYNNAAELDNVNLQPLYVKGALETFNVDKCYSKKESEYLSCLAGMGNFMATPQGQQLRYQEQAARIHSESRRLADLEIQSSKGYKSSYKCEIDKAKKYSKQKQTVADCIVNNPAGYIDNQLISRLSGNFFKKEKPPDHSAEIGRLIGGTLSNILGEQLFSGGSGGANYIISEGASGFARSIGILEQARANIFQMYDSRGMKVASAGDSISLPSGQEIKLSWNASQIRGASFVILKCNDNPRLCGGRPVKQRYDIADSETLPFNSTSVYAIEIWGAASGDKKDTLTITVAAQ